MSDLGDVRLSFMKSWPCKPVFPGLLLVASLLYVTSLFATCAVHMPLMTKLSSAFCEKTAVGDKLVSVVRWPKPSSIARVSSSAGS